MTKAAKSSNPLSPHRRIVFECVILGIMILGLVLPKLGISFMPSKFSVNSGSYKLIDPQEADANSIMGVLFGKRRILLTFDDGPSDPMIDQALLNILKKHNAHSIWFINCKNLDPNLSSIFNKNRAMLYQVMDAGNEIANHSYHHYNLSQLDNQDPQKMRNEVRSCSGYIEKLTGKRPRYFRAPWGQYTPNVKDFASRQGMLTMMWSVNSMDMTMSEKPVVRTAIEHRMQHLLPANGDIVLFHENALTLQLLEDFLTKLDAEGYSYIEPNQL